jgi:hypothetical protein
MLHPALLGGLAIGVLSALPVINLANCCCAWVLFGGGLAAYLMQQSRAQPISAGDGALVGLMAGAIGAVVLALVSIPINALMLPFQSDMLDQVLTNASDMPPEVRELLEGLRGGAFAGAASFLVFVVSLVVFSVFGLFGGLIGALVFRKNAPPPPPPPVPTFTPPAFTPPPPTWPPPPPEA